jgi:hypothetical protein
LITAGPLGDSGKEVVEVIKDLFAWEVEKVWKTCVVKTPTVSYAGDLAEVPFGKEGESDPRSFVSMEGKENGLAGSGVERVWGERSGGTSARTEGKGKSGDEAGWNMVGGRNKVSVSVTGVKAFKLVGSNTVVQYCKEEGGVHAGPKVWRVKKLKTTLTLG